MHNKFYDGQFIIFQNDATKKAFSKSRKGFKIW
ncbi:hypothetical protein SAMN05192545_2725 [Maribacter dokdonensis]|uniref:Uncharacterized protein n=1 Tax=Maribacter dokdonensis TaxID=320912 RepID=A0A1H4N347_9FLAO|nr:hypothetical protein SAMN05192545_2725 [Maribacter dokdonensis]SEB89434.1 hypothetical protein SAMN05192540_1826 [Maribacter dokdonensis]